VVGGSGELLLVRAGLLQHSGTGERALGLPGWDTDVRDPGGIGEDSLDLLERLTAGLREHEERVDTHDGAEDTEQDVDLPLDIFKGRWHEVTESEVEGPVE